MKDKKLHSFENKRIHKCKMKKRDIYLSDSERAKSSTCRETVKVDKPVITRLAVDFS
jgi:hypothetical protein